MKTLTIELGASTSWRNYNAGKWQKLTAEEAKKPQYRGQNYIHVPARHTVTVPDAIADGLVAEAVRWDKANQQRSAEGVVNRMMRIISADEKDAKALRAQLNGEPVTLGVRQQPVYILDAGPDPAPATAVIGIGVLRDLLKELIAGLMGKKATA